jgi:hypothetical protein
MPEEKRVFEFEALGVPSLHYKQVREDEGELLRTASIRVRKQKTTFSREVILRLVEWLEKKSA